MPDRHPALEFVMSGPMQQIGNPNRRRRPSGLKTGESGRVVHNIVRYQNFVSSAGLKIPGRSVVHSASNSDSGEQQDVSAVPKTMNYGFHTLGIGARCNRRRALHRARIFRQILSIEGMNSHHQNENERRTKSHFQIVAGRLRLNPPRNQCVTK